MKKIINYIILFIFITVGFSSSMLKSMIFPGWGELNEYKILSIDNSYENVKYIKERSKYIMLQESSLWIGFFVFQNLSKTYKNDYRLLGEMNAGINWNGKDDLFAANVGIFDNLIEYNHYKLKTGQYDDQYLEEGYNWDWQNNNDNISKYERVRNKSEKYDKFKTYLAAGLIINRVVSAFDVLSIMKNHGRIISFDIEEDPNTFKFNLNYHF